MATTALDLADASKSVKKASKMFDSVITNGLKMQKLMESACLELMPVLGDEDKNEYLDIVTSCKQLRDDTHAELNGITLMIRHYVDGSEAEVGEAEQNERFSALVGKINGLFPTSSSTEEDGGGGDVLALEAGAPALPPRPEAGTVAMHQSGGSVVPVSGTPLEEQDLPRMALELRAKLLHDRVVRFRENLRSAGYASRVVSQLLTSVVTSVVAVGSSLVCLGGGVAAATGVIMGVVGSLTGGLGSLAGVVGILIAAGVPILLGAGALAIGSACLGISSAVGMVKGALLLKKSDKISKKMQKDCAEVQSQMAMLKSYATLPGSPKIFCELSDNLRESLWKAEDC